ncbi:PAS domain-containing protein [Chitinophaga silvisoli]|uniref:histidine kinase n=1 Tax=Chitinophaga silvisoli TaxID=2291814 RepID=A0A3E1NTN9_9BACT|nr:PAS domain-containing protein [Chitinophaga silvisoli]RFM31292.1 PAS domain S-box protein [Chitinophaga silvisoli]
MNLTRLEFDQARSMHLHFKAQLRSILYGGAVDQVPILSEHECAFGKWMHDHVLPRYSHLPEMQQLEQVHTAIHRCAQKLIGLYDSGSHEAARSGLTDMEGIANELMDLLAGVETQILSSENNDDLVVENRGEKIEEFRTLYQSVNQLEEHIREGIRKDVVYDDSRFRESVEQAPVGIAIFRTRDMVFEMANAMYLELITRPIEAVVGRSLYDVLPEVRELVKPLLDNVWDTVTPHYGNEFPVTLLRHGVPELVYFNFVYQPLKNTKGEIDGVMVAATDVTAAVEAKHSLVESEIQFRNLVMQSPIAMAIFKGKDMVIDMANYTMLKTLWRRSSEEVTGRTLLDVFPELEGQKFPALLQQVFDSGIAHKEKEAIAYVNGPDGMKRFYLDFEYTPLFDLEKNVYGIMATVYDVTERKEQDMALRLSEEKFRVLGETLPQMIWTTDPEGRLNYASKRYFEFTGMTLEQLNGVGWFTVIHPEDLIRNLPVWKDAVAKGIEYQIEHRMKKADGTYRWHLTRTVPQKDTEGNVKMWVGSTTDIHEGKMFIDKLEAEVQARTKELQKSNDDLRNSNEELAQFAYVASHDLQEPLRKIQTFTSRLLETEYKNISDKGKDYFNRMQAAAQRMRQLIEDLLSFSRTSNNGEQLFEYVDLTQVLLRVKEQLSDQIDKKEAVIEYDLLPVLSAIPYQMEQLFMNLLNNALKFSRKGVKPLIKVKMEDNVYTLVGGLPHHKITIADNGIGFDPQFSERIFQVFQRLHVRNQFEGTGIGLAICKKIMDNHKGVITAEGFPDQGSVFTLLFPVA